MNAIKTKLKDKLQKQNQINRMKLHALSQNNRYFLFEDELMKTLKVYKLFNVEQK